MLLIIDTHCKSASQHKGSTKSIDSITTTNLSIASTINKNNMIKRGICMPKHNTISQPFVHNFRHCKNVDVQSLWKFFIFFGYRWWTLKHWRHKFIELDVHIIMEALHELVCDHGQWKDVFAKFPKESPHVFSSKSWHSQSLTQKFYYIIFSVLR